MQIVIDIPDPYYENNIKKELPIFLSEEEVVTILPKGHGRLIDADAIITKATKEMKYPLNHEYMECVIAHMNLAPTITEADEESGVEE